ncbi:MAG TPA: hypothetical protein VFW02_06490 [Candidatus Limnocylindrales bacterium]|nr:hypothetical protein [Candidatus Limnocylindrales bacterium]
MSLLRSTIYRVPYYYGAGSTCQVPAAKPWKAALVADGIPCTSFAVDDTCGNLIQIVNVATA